MPHLSQVQIEKIRYHCGYREIEQMASTPLTEEFSAEEVTQVQRLIDELADVDKALTAARTDSMAIAVGNLKVDYRQHVQHLKDEGTRVLEELAHLTDIHLHRNKYKSSGQQYSMSALNY